MIKQTVQNRRSVSAGDIASLVVNALTQTVTLSTFFISAGAEPEAEQVFLFEV
jgi:hypothetical protein